MSASSPARENRPQSITLVQAAEAGDFGSVEVLSAAGVDVNSATEHGMTALMSAAANGHLGLVSLLLERGADINAKRSDGLDALALAAFFGHLHVVRELLGRGADLKSKSRFGTSPEMWATARGFHNIAQIITDAKTVNSREALTHRSDENAPLPELTSAQESILSEALFSDEGVSDETLFHATKASQIPIQIFPDSTHDDEGSLGSINSPELTIESPASIWNMADEEHKEDQVEPRNRGTIAEPMAAELRHNGADIFAPMITLRSRALPVEKQPFPIYSTYVAKPRYHHKRKSRKLVKCLAYITSDWQRLTVVTLIVMFICGLGTLTFFKLLSPSKPSGAAKPANVTESLAPDLPHFSAQNDLHSTTRAEEIPSMRAIDDAFGEQSIDSAKRSDDRRGLQVDRVGYPNSLRVADRHLRKSAERVTDARPKQAITTKQETQAVSSFRSASISAKRIPSRNAADLALEDTSAKAPPNASPAPLSIEMQRPRSAAARNDSSAPTATPGRNAKTKVIQWP